jgi:lysophospholipase
MNKYKYKKQGLRNMATPSETTHDTTLASAFNLVRFYPSGVKSGSFRNDEGRDVYYYKAAPVGELKGRVVFTPGYGDSVNYHYDAVRKWQERGFEVYAMDWIGQGLSDRENPAQVQDANDRLMNRHMLDLQKFVQEIVPKDRSVPLILSTHSMGGHVGMLHLKNFPGTFDGAVLAAPLLDLNTSILPRSAFKGIVSAMNSLGFDDNSLPNWRNLLNRVKATSGNIADLTQNDPAKLTLSQQGQLRMEELLKGVQVGLPTWGFLRRIYPSLDEMRRDDYFDNIRTPVLLVAAGRDELIENKSIRFAAKELPKGFLLELPTSTHNVWNDSERNKDTLWKAIDQFVDHGMNAAPQKRPAPPAPSQPLGSPAFAAA